MKLAIILFVILYLSGENFGQNPLKDDDRVFVTRTEDGYSYSFRTKDISRYESGAFTKTDKSDNPVLNVFGTYRFIATNGKVYFVSYKANDKGFYPVITLGDTLAPVPQPILGTAVIKTLGGSGIG